jgi:hypothetical protein
MTTPAAAPSVFSSIFGGGAVQATDTKAATADIANLNSNFAGMSSSLTSSISTATALSPDLKGMVDTTALTSALDSTKNLQETCKGLSTDDCAKKQAQLQAETDAAQLKFFTDALAAQITKLTAERDKIQKQYDAIKAEKDAALKAGALVFKADSVFPSYDELLGRINADIATLKASAPYIVSSAAEGFQSSSSSGSTQIVVPPPYKLPVLKSAGDYAMEHEVLLATYNNLLGNPYDLNRIVRTLKTFVYRQLIPAFFYMALIISIIWGGVVCSNMYVEVEQDFLGARIWYFIHGMIGFPLAIAYSLIKPPYWVSGIFPWYARVAADEEDSTTTENATNAENTTNAENATNATNDPTANSADA